MTGVGPVPGQRILMLLREELIEPNRTIGVRTLLIRWRQHGGRTRRREAGCCKALNGECAFLHTGAPVA